METMLTIGAFAAASRLSPKALRLYDELDLLRPARVDPDTGYRYYALAQLERARLVACDSPADVERLLTPGGTVVVDDFTPATTWPPLHDGVPDLARLHWLEHPALRSAELRLAPDLSTVVGTRRLV